MFGPNPSLFSFPAEKAFKLRIYVRGETLPLPLQLSFNLLETMPFFNGNDDIKKISYLITPFFLSSLHLLSFCFPSVNLITFFAFKYRRNQRGEIKDPNLLNPISELRRYYFHLSLSAARGEKREKKESGSHLLEISVF